MSIWRGRTTEMRLPLNLYEDTAKNLQKGLFRGYGKNLKKLDIESPDYKTLSKLNKNIYVFSAAKTFHEVKDMQNFIYDERGFLRSFTEFSKDTNIIYEQYSVNWQRTEFDTTIAQAQSAAQWDDIQKEKKTFPLLKYQTAGDDKVRDLHASWDGTVRPVNDGFWADRMPPNSWNCRCIAVQLEEGEEKLTDARTLKVNDDKLFSMNPGRDQYIFKETGRNQHPYFKVDKKYSVLKKNNFNLPIPK